MVGTKTTSDILASLKEWLNKFSWESIAMREIIDAETKNDLKLSEQLLKAGRLKLVPVEEMNRRLKKMEEEGDQFISELKRKSDKPHM